MVEIQQERALLNLTEFCDYIGVGKTKGRYILTKTDNPFMLRLDGRLYAHKGLLDKWLISRCGNKVNR